MFFIPSKKDIQEEVSGYSDLTFFKKTKNVFVLFIVFVVVISLYFFDSFSVSSQEQLFGLGTYLVLAVFIYFNHRWAIVVFTLMYLGDKVMLLAAGFGSPVTQLLFGYIAALGAYQAFRVATLLKKNS